MDNQFNYDHADKIVPLTNIGAIEHNLKNYSEEKSIYEVTVLDKENNLFKHQWQVEKFINKGLLKNCWMTTFFSSPLSIGSSI